MFRHLLTRLRIAYLQLKIRWTQDEIDAITEALQSLPIEREHFQRHRLGLCRELAARRSQAASEALERRFKAAPARIRRLHHR